MGTKWFAWTVVVGVAGGLGMAVVLWISAGDAKDVLPQPAHAKPCAASEKGGASRRAGEALGASELTSPPETSPPGAEPLATGGGFASPTMPWDDIAATHPDTLFKGLGVAGKLLGRDIQANLRPVMSSSFSECFSRSPFPAGHAEYEADVVLDVEVEDQQITILGANTTNASYVDAAVEDCMRQRLLGAMNSSQVFPERKRIRIAYPILYYAPTRR